ncbi:DedA family protein [Brevibacillus ruminantium]|uniref:DedA family protein n=1 Tax=Brevibacillus ruminantium TaxID=2950604 RepID=A0ABY4WEV7_9BACL|nr:DedA family protein [Brevibacillus ruminantium]USG65667.1 DedA family protein [Brevibacillus ruminantium]
MMDIMKELIDQYGYFALYFLLALGIVGLPIPDETIMTFVGYLTSIQIFNFFAALTVSFLGAISGMIFSYFLGRKFGRPLLLKYGWWLRLTPARLNKAERWFDRYGLWAVCFGYFIPGVRHFTCYLSGISGIRFRKYLLFAGFGALIWCITFITAGYFIGESISILSQ